jgi:hypothetical protein
VGTAIAVVVILAVAVGLRAHRKLGEAPVAAHTQPPPKVAAAPKAGAPAAPAKEAPRKEAAKTAAEKAAAAKKPVDKKSAPAPSVLAKAPEPAAKAASEAKPAAGGTGTVKLTITPWGEVYVDGKHRGDVPPMYEMSLSAGKHRIEIRHLDFPPYVRTLDIAPGARVDIKHWFVREQNPFLPWNK